MIQELQKLGLTEYESKTYIALLELGPSMGGDVARKAKIPSTRVFDVLRGLVELGLVHLLDQKPMIWSAIKPKQGIKSLIDIKINNLNDIEKTISKKIQQIKKATPQKIHEKVIVVSGFDKLFNMLNTYLKQTKHHYNILSVGEEIPYPHLLECKRAINRGVNLKLIVTKNDEENKKIIKKRISNKWQVKHFPGSQSWTFAILDDVCLINVRNPIIKDERITIFFENPDLAKALNGYYKQLWNKSKFV